ncbi:MAG: hypothetical protein NUW01_03575 [Gemmatimonadaceae bacterium]|nr:hypothetical protein [Gemmatimonadaceae bacterium]
MDDETDSALVAHINAAHIIYTNGFPWEGAIPLKQIDAQRLHLAMHESPEPTDPGFIPGRIGGEGRA